MKPLAIKIGGSTFGKSDTTVEDLVTLQKRGVPVVVIHGGGQAVTDWLSRLDISTTFVRGLRVTDLETLRVVTAVLAGVVNKELVSAIWRLGGKAVGLCGADGVLSLRGHVCGFVQGAGRAGLAQGRGPDGRRRLRRGRGSEPVATAVRAGVTRAGGTLGTAPGR